MNRKKTYKGVNNILIDTDDDIINISIYIPISKTVVMGDRR